MCMQMQEEIFSEIVINQYRIVRGGFYHLFLNREEFYYNSVKMIKLIFDKGFTEIVEEIEFKDSMKWLTIWCRLSKNYTGETNSVEMRESFLDKSSHEVSTEWVVLLPSFFLSRICYHALFADH